MDMHRAILAALASALLFGVSTPLAKVLVSDVSPVALAGLLYLSSGIGLLGLRWLGGRVSASFRVRETSLARRDWGWMAGAVLTGGVIAPVLLMLGLTRTPGSTAALLLNLEGVFTALLAWILFRENVDQRLVTGFFLISAAALILSWEGIPSGEIPLGALAVVSACACWAVDNNLTQRISGSDPLQVAGIKGLTAGCINLGLAYLIGWQQPPAPVVFAALLVGFLGYGLSLSLFVWALRHLGTARTGAYFSVAPFFGATTAILVFSEQPGAAFWLAAAMMVAGVWLHISEHHVHEHRHERLIHAHRHYHDEHHRHAHGDGWDGSEPHSHAHEHAPLVHAHPHYPDLHHRHRH